MAAENNIESTYIYTYSQLNQTKVYLYSSYISMSCL